MFHDSVTRPTRARQRTAAIAAVILVPLASLLVASSALAKEPTGDFAVFKQCPRFTEGVKRCIYSQTASGELKLNELAVPIVNTITLQGGVKGSGETETFVGALNGETLSKTAQKVPGGLMGLVRCNEIKGEGFVEKLQRSVCEQIYEHGETALNAVVELAKPASEIGINHNNLINKKGTALSLPVKVHLENPFLGKECYIGSTARPVTLNLTSGATSPPPPNKPISGKLGKLEYKDNKTFLAITENTLVDNAFSAPEASGCGGIYSFLIDPIIDGKYGLPAAAGKNTVILNNFIREAEAEAVIKSEK